MSAGPDPAAGARTLRLTIEYDGTDFAGWQRQLGQRTIQGCLEEALASMVGAPVAVRGAGRTDAGVHADGQVASARVVAPRIPVSGFVRGLNTHLPPDIAVTEVADVDATFDARRSARGKVYVYRIWNHIVRSPRHARQSWHVRAALDLHAMRGAAAALIGRHDFRGFRAADCERLNTVRELRRVDVARAGALIVIEVEGTAFLKNMVRIIAGTLVAAGLGELDATGVRAILADGDRTRAGVTAPACGLTLARVLY
jgi:tRNA pseudouridine38-40 synthase